MSTERTTTVSELGTGLRHLRRLETFLDVIYGLLFWEMISYLPKVEDMAWVGQDWGVLAVFVQHPEQSLRVVIGVGLTLMNWAASNRQLGGMTATDGKHASFCMAQVVFVCFFVYFAIADPKLEGGPSSPAMQCVSVALAGIFGVFGWRYAIAQGLVMSSVDEKERSQTMRSGLIEPIVALLTLPFAWVGPGIWTLGWFVFPLPVKWLLVKREIQKKKRASRTPPPDSRA